MTRSRSRENTGLLPGLCQRLWHSVWLFPFVLLVLLTLLTALGISGSSIGSYYPGLYGTAQKDPSLLVGHPQLIRSDEWLVNTQLTIAQSAAGFPAINHNVHGGTDMSVAGDVPYKDWSAAFRPQNLIFFVLPLAYAFAFKWWLLLSLTIVSCYFVILRFFPGKRLLAALLSSAVGLSPFLFWWYITSALAPFFYGLFIILIGWRIINNERIIFLKKSKPVYSHLAHVAILSYLLISFALILYPPFQIPIVLCVAAFLAGLMLEKYGLGRHLFSKDSLGRIGIFAASLLLTGLAVLLFIHTHSRAVNAVQHTVYPGSRQVVSGHTPLFEIFSTYLQPQLQRTGRAVHYYINQSEASNFLLFLPFLLLPGFMLIYLQFRQKRKLRWSFLLIQLLGILFLARLFIAGLRPLYNLFLLGKVPNDRLLIGLGFAGILQLLFVMKYLVSVRISKKRLDWLAGSYTFLCLLVLGWAGRYVRDTYPQFIHSTLFIGFLGVFFAGIIFCFLSRRFMLGALLFLVFSVGCVFRIHPLYQGLGPFYPSRLTQAIDTVSKPGDTWVTLDDIDYENIAMVSNRDSLSGVQSYPDFGLWQQVEGPKGDFIYNRYAHVLFNTSSAMTDKLYLGAADTFLVKFGCSPFIERNVRYALATHPIANSCTKLAGEVRYPAKTFYLYRVSH